MTTLFEEQAEPAAPSTDLAHNGASVSYLLPRDIFHERSQPYVSGLESGDYHLHLPMLAFVEAIAAISRRAESNKLALVARVRKSIEDWEHAGYVQFYDMDRARMEIAARVAERDGLRGSDAVLAGLAEELNIDLKTFDEDVQNRFARASA